MMYGITDQYHFHFLKNITNTNVKWVNIFCNRNSILTNAPNGHGRKYQLTQKFSLSMNVYENLLIRHINKTGTFLTYHGILLDKLNLCYIGKAVLLQAWSGPEGSRKLRFPDFTTTAQDGGMVVSLTHRPPLPPGNTPGTHFC